MNQPNQTETHQEKTAPKWLFVLLTLGMVILFAGFAVVFAASASNSGTSTSTGIVIFIGPIPIVFGSGPDAVLLILMRFNHCSNKHTAVCGL
jgi:uncharacterized membrane protein